ncbi:MAG TPA: AgmX/PglI C-terminal domain-containing protein [Kofleriaceae bacterium]|jgi:tetratricopeptide (TPR) repeat protein
MNRLSLVSLMLGLAACGGSTPSTNEPGTGSGSGSAAKPAAAGDVSFEVPEIKIEGVIFEPEALGRPGMPLVEAKKKITLDKQRQTFQTAKDPVLKEAQAAILATMLYQQSKTDTANEQALLTEARQALRDAAANSGDKVDEITLRLLGSYELILGDFAGAEKAWAMLVNKDPKSKELPFNKAWWAYSLLRQSKNQEALAVVQNEKMDEKQPELAYTAAWAKWRTGDDAGAWTALVIAAKGWGQLANREVIDRDLFLFASRSKNVSLAQASPALFGVFNAKQPGQKYPILVKLGRDGYGYAGRWADAISAIDEAITTVGTTIPVDDAPKLRYTQVLYEARLDQPEQTAKYADQAIKAMPACGTKCKPDEMQAIITNIYGTGRLFHVLYATANDVRYYQPAHDIYLATTALIMDDAKRAEAQKDIAVLEATLKNTKAGTGTHDKGAIGALLQQHNQEVQACYETALASNPKIAGRVELNLESNETGAITGASTDPKGGLADLALVAGCVTEQAKSWKLPKRGSKGNTRIKLVYSFAPAKAAK